MYQITDENGERMPLLESLLNFIKDNKVSTFITGRWLSTLSMDELENLAGQTELNTPCSMLIAKKAYQAETCLVNFDDKLEHDELEDDELDRMCLIYMIMKCLIGCELARRVGIMILESELSVDPNKSLQFRLTDKGKEYKRSILN